MNYIKIFITLFALLSGSVTFGQQPGLEIKELKNGIFVYTTYKDFKGSPFPSNSMYLVAQEGIVLLDTPWDSTQFQPLMDSLWQKHKKKPIACIVSHFHDDRTAGLDFLKSKGVPTYSSVYTAELGKKYGEKLAQYRFYSDTVFTFGEHKIATYYPGEGHTPDNILLYIEKDKVLFGACFMKSCESKGLGNLEHANVKEWKISIEKSIKKYKKCSYFVPGHQAWSKTNALIHTKKLIKKELRIMN